MSKVMIRLHDKDNDSYELYTESNGQYIVWAIVHEDILFHLKGGASDRGGVKKMDIENMERELSIV
jgi:hypothetical protein